MFSFFIHYGKLYNQVVKNIRFFSSKRKFEIMADLQRKFLKNIFSSSSAFTIRILLNFFFIPYITSTFGSARYGVWIIIFQTVAYFTLFDFGINSALTRFVSKAFAKKDFKTINKTLSTANALYFLIGTAVGLLVYLLAELYFNMFEISSPELIAEGKTALILLGVFLAFQFYMMAFGNSHGAFQRLDISKNLLAAEEIVRIAVMSILLYYGYGLIALALTIVVTTILRSTLGIIWLKKLFPEIRLSFHFDKDSARQLFGYSKITLFISLCWLVLYGSDSFILGLLSTTAAAGIYAPGAQLMLYIRNLINIVGVPLVPAISHLESQESFVRIQIIYLKGLKYISYISFAMMSSVLFFAESFVRLWLDVQFAQTADVIKILAIGTAFFLPQIIGNSILFGCEKHKIILQVAIVETISKLLLVIFLVPLFGIVGMAMANTIPQVILYTTLYPFLISKVLKIPFGRILYEMLKTGTLGMITAYLFSSLLRKFYIIDSWLSFAWQTGLVVIILLIVGYFILEKDDRTMLKEFVL